MRWGWGWGWVVVVARMVPHRREDQRSQDAVMLMTFVWQAWIPQWHAFALPHALHLHHSSMTASLSSFGSALAPWTWLGGFKFLLRARHHKSQTIPIPMARSKLRLSIGLTPEEITYLLHHCSRVLQHWRFRPKSRFQIRLHHPLRLDFVAGFTALYDTTVFREFGGGAARRVAFRILWLQMSQQGTVGAFPSFGT